MSYQFRQWRVRDDVLDSMKRYVDMRVPVGDFLTAVICNDLKEALGRADDDNLENIPAIVAWFYNEAPRLCWGSKERMSAWMNPKQE